METHMGLESCRGPVQQDMSECIKQDEFLYTS